MPKKETQISSTAWVQREHGISISMYLCIHNSFLRSLTLRQDCTEIYCENCVNLD